MYYNHYPFKLLLCIVIQTVRTYEYYGKDNL